MLLSRLAMALVAVSTLAAEPVDWVPARWPWSDPASLDLIEGTPINCLLVSTWTQAFVEAAAARKLALLSVVPPDGDPVAGARRAAKAGLAGVVVERELPEDIARQVAEAAAGLVLIELGPRHRMKLGGAAPVIGTRQGVWPGIQVLEGGAAKAAPTGSPWIDTNSGFLRAVRAWGHRTIWVGSVPPAGTIVLGERYLQAIADCAMAGGRWVVSLDSDFAARLAKREAAALRDWKRMAAMLAYFERHPEWRGYEPVGKLAVVQDPENGALLSGGILDMIGARHTPVRPVPVARLSPEALAGSAITVNVAGAELPAAKQEVLKGFARGGGTLLNAPAGALAGHSPDAATLTLEKAELERVADLWRDVQSLIGRRNLGVRLFNVSAMLSNLLASPDGKTVVLHLVNYFGYPVESVTVHLEGTFRSARLLSPNGTEKNLEIYPVEGGVGVDIPSVSVCATLRLD
ncbi:MAG TPA: hypothetical protein VN442_26195 [Bryobacteraceae bacterium]|nr:hypothetical protein [Bryobacteraceae bacterium]